MKAYFEGKGEIRADVRYNRCTLIVAKNHAFIDANGRRWDVPVGAEIREAGGAPVIGSLFCGWRSHPLLSEILSIHDWFCQTRTRSWRDTHRMLYEGMVASGFFQPVAKMIYFGVRWCGPRWESGATAHRPSSRQLPFVPNPYMSRSEDEPYGTAQRLEAPGASFHKDAQTELFFAFARQIDFWQPELDEIENWADLLDYRADVQIDEQGLAKPRISPPANL